MTEPQNPTKRKPGRPTTPELERFIRHCAPADGNGCVLWTGMCDLAGYPKFAGTDVYGEKRVMQCHRYIYEKTIAPLLPGQMVLRTCGRRTCVSPAHLQAQAAVDTGAILNDPAHPDFERVRNRHGWKMLRESPHAQQCFARSVQQGRASNMALAMEFGISLTQVPQARLLWGAQRVDIS